MGNTITTSANVKEMTISYSTATATTNPIKFYWGLADFNGDLKHVIDFFAIEHKT